MNKTLLVTGIGGNVAQGIIRTIRHLYPKFKVIGTNAKFVSAGNFLCDEVIEVPMSYADNYIDKMIEICNHHDVDLIIPATDYETYYLAKNRDLLPTVACSDDTTSEIFLKKSLTHQVFKKHGIPFASTDFPSKYKGEFKNIIVKPDEGRGSSGIHINPDNLYTFDDSYIIQELIVGTEITTAFYVTKSNELLGQITMVRHLHNGTTVLSEVVMKYDHKMTDILQKIIRVIPIKGSCNIQCIVSESGEIIPFEINGRISGTNSIRANFGFEDVKYTLQEYLLNEVPDKPIIKKGSAARILMDIIYPDISISEISNNSNTSYIY